MCAHEPVVFRALRGADDVLASDTARWQWLEERARAACRAFGYQEVRTPLIEEAQLFTRSVGEATDIVQKEMYVFQDRGGRAIALRPEGTASMVRAYVEHECFKTDGLVKWSYCGPMFRAERPQAGRKRQFHQIGAEAIGASHPLLDAELIALALAILQAAGVTGSRVRVNNVGCRADRAAASERLREQLAPHRAALCEDCQGRLERNVFRVLDCKRETCRALVQRMGAAMQPCEPCRTHHAQVLDALRAAQIVVEEDATIVRGLDYYTKTVFEISHSALGAQDALGAGGRYDNLVEELGGPDTGASGFALGMERMLLAVEAAATMPAPAAPAVAAVLPLDDAAQMEAFAVLHTLRSANIPAVMDVTSKSLKAQMRSANKAGARAALLLGAQERAQGTVTLKDMAGGAQTSVPRADIIAAVQHLLA